MKIQVQGQGELFGFDCLRSAIPGNRYRKWGESPIVSDRDYFRELRFADRVRSIVLMSALKKQFFWYMAGVTSFVIPMGIQTILFPKIQRTKTYPQEMMSHLL